MSSTLLITGATGFIGRALVARHLREGGQVIALSRDAARAQQLLGQQVRMLSRLDDLPDSARIDACVHLAGARVLGPPWSAARRALLVQSRHGVAMALQALLKRLHERPKVLVAASAIGYYGNPALAPAAALDERGPPQPGQFQSDLCAGIERDALAAEGLGLRVVCLRLGVVLGQGGGAYPAQALAARLGLGAVLGSGQQALAWLHLDDAVGLVQHALATPALRGPVNAVAPEVCSQAEFTRALAASFGRRAWLRVPAAALRLSMGEMSELLLGGVPLAPAAALQSGYRFRYPQLEGALAALAAGAEPAPG
ncbi:TIGR01777 family oxidoreductase [Roseateles paludis]|uniref:TIGR01777 family oxidoreductase n=1 Tax=Roseateles paludis TaxID=3145238 RepID=A0ABV0G1P9_9BURK